MILAKSELRKALKAGEIDILDDLGNLLPEWHGGFPDPVGLQPASIDLTLGDHWLVPHANARSTDWARPPEFTTMKGPIHYTESNSPTFMIPAHGFILARTAEVIRISEDLFAKVEGRSSVGRLGLVVETAGVVDPGFHGSITLELLNCLPYPLEVHAGARICQIVVSRISGSSEGGYATKGKYQKQVKATGSKLHMDFEK